MGKEILEKERDNLQWGEEDTRVRTNNGEQKANVFMERDGILR